MPTLGTLTIDYWGGREGGMEGTWVCGCANARKCECARKRVITSQYCAQTCPPCQACLVGPWTLPLLLLALWSSTLTIVYKSGGKKGGRG